MSIEKQKKEEDRNILWMNKVGCTYEEYLHIRNRPDNPTRIFSTFRRNIRYISHIPCNIKFYEWWVLWQESGHWIDRGRKQGGYIMVPINRKKALDKTNARIISLKQTMKERAGRMGSKHYMIKEVRCKKYISYYLYVYGNYSGRFTSKYSAAKEAKRILNIDQN